MTVPVTYVAGSSHSGSTLLALLADEHPELASVGETAVARAIRRDGRAAQQLCSCGARLAACPFWRRVFSRLRAAGVPSDATVWSHEYRFDHPWLDRALTRDTSSAWLLGARRWAQRHSAAYRRRVARIDRANVLFMRAVLTERGATVFLDTTKLAARLERLLAVPELDVRVVQLVRDVRGVAASHKRRGQSAVAAAHVWRSDQLALVSLVRRLPAERVLLLRYEDLCADPRTALARLWRFCGLTPIEPSHLVSPRHHHLLGNRVRLQDVVDVRVDGSWTATLDRTEQRQVLDAAGPLHRELGYS